MSTKKPTLSQQLEEVRETLNIHSQQLESLGSKLAQRKGVDNDPLRRLAAVSTVSEANDLLSDGWKFVGLCPVRNHMMFVVGRGD